MSKETTGITFKGLTIWSIAMLFYFYECFTRVFPNTLSDNLIAGLNINAEQYSLIGSSFFLIYAIMQVPVGYLINRLGVRLSTTIASIIAALGVLWFSFANSLSTAVIARLLMGFGASFGYIAILLLALNWFPRKHFGFFTGLSQLLGSIGPILAGAPLAILLHVTDNRWRLILSLFGILGLLIALLIALFVKNKPPSQAQIIHLEIPKKQSDVLFPTLRKPRLWLMILYTAAIYTPIPMIGTYWGVLYLQARGFHKPEAAFLTSMIWIGYAFGSPLIGRLSDSTRRRLPYLRLTALIGILATLYLLYVPSHSIPVLTLVFIAIGFAATGQSLSVATISEFSPSKLQSTLMGLTNSLLMLFGAILPSIAGAIIHTSKHTDQTGTTFYSAFDFARGLSLMPILFALALLVALFGIRETFCRPQGELLRVKREKE